MEDIALACQRKIPNMARPPNYSFERQQRERAKEQKAAEKAALKREQRELARLQSEGGAPGSDQDLPD